MESKRNLESIFTIIIFILLGVGLLLYAILPVNHSILIYTATPVLLIITSLALWSETKGRDDKFLRYFIIFSFLTFIIEIAGSKSGAIFGDYTYGDGLGLKVFGVPPVIGLNWVTIVVGALLIVKRYLGNLSRWVAALAVGAIAVALDVLIEPVAIALDYWEWEQVSVPLQNYVAWFLIAYVIALWMSKFEYRSLLWVRILIVQFAYFGLLNILL